MLWLAPIAVLCCQGGPQSGARSPDSPASDDAEDAEYSEDGQPLHEEPPRAACADDGCFQCGESVCLAGWYCDEAAPGGAACAWLPDCGEKPGCACVQSVLGNDCDCEQRDSGVFVSCAAP